MARLRGTATMFDTIYKMAMLTVECQQVIGMRMMKAAMGGVAAGEEAALMMSEKTEAAMRYGPAFMAGGSLEKMVDDYRAIVQANVVRLSQA
ncbi:hypothetical protein EK403_08680 [Hansschlegelia zhihuaiae]|uniref:Uncharacterized protein n=2 Tax=Hansschlegelia zhihuaiae TaxID=405005 RepID=A0A4Q0MK51_9HYPH|nr:hypothetical protein EK403_08680 [Hansschlegelia zhihuaiae]